MAILEGRVEAGEGWVISRARGKGRKGESHYKMEG